MNDLDILFCNFALIYISKCHSQMKGGKKPCNKKFLCMFLTKTDMCHVHSVTAIPLFALFE